MSFFVWCNGKTERLISYYLKDDFIETFLTAAESLHVRNKSWYPSTGKYKTV